MLAYIQSGSQISMCLTFPQGRGRININSADVTKVDQMCKYSFNIFNIIHRFMAEWVSENTIYSHQNVYRLQNTKVHTQNFYITNSFIHRYININIEYLPVTTTKQLQNNGISYS